MPIDFKKVLTQIKNLEGQDKNNLAQGWLNATYNEFNNAKDKSEKLVKKLAETESTSKATFTFGIPALQENETLGDLINADADFSMPHVVVATDGSQIYSSSHEIASASLINIGLVAIPYFEKTIPVTLSSEPKIYSSTEEINPSLSEERISDEDLISYERTLKEIEGLTKLAKEYSKHNVPVVALLDGTLIHWHIERFNNAFIEQFIKRFSDSIFELKSLGIPVASVISKSRSNDIINMLRIHKCPYETVDCKKHCASISSKDTPCNPILDYKPVHDRRVIEKYFTQKKAKTATRTVLFRSNNKILSYYPDELKVCFFYINSGTEVARIELPSYVIKDKKMLSLLHHAIGIQFKVGFGYPVVLSEAHIQAVVNKNDRQIFYDLLKEHMLKYSHEPMKLSTKELKKRISFV